MTYKDILYVITILDEGSFSAAAKKLYVSQSALSQAVRKLEQEFGMELFIRSGGSTHFVTGSVNPHIQLVFIKLLHWGISSFIHFTASAKAVSQSG